MDLQWRDAGVRLLFLLCSLLVVALWCPLETSIPDLS